MKLIILLATVVAAYCNGIPMNLGLSHFDMSQLSTDFKEFKVPSECSTPVKQCLACTHALAKKCILKWFKKHSSHIRECKQKEGVADLDQAWQESSLKWHKTFQDCVTGEDLPEEAEQDEEDSMLVFRRKRGLSENLDLGDCPDVMDTTYEECWKTFKGTMHTCKTEASGCDAYQTCSGEGPAPEDATKLKWFNLMKRIGSEKKGKKIEYHRRMHECMHPGADFEAHLKKLYGKDD